MCFAITITHLLDHIAIHMLGHIGDILDRIEIGDQGNHDPVIVVDPLVAGDDGAQLAEARSGATFTGVSAQIC